MITIERKLQDKWSPVTCPTNKNNGGACAVGSGILMFHVPIKAREKKRSRLVTRTGSTVLPSAESWYEQRANDMAHHLRLFVCLSSTDVAVVA